MNKHEKNLIVFAGSLLFSGIIFGAFGAHILKEILSESALEIFKTGVFYQITQGLGLLLLVLIQKSFSLNLKLSSKLISIGILLFSGSIYILSLSELIDLGAFKIIVGPITPIGGLQMIVGWFAFILKSIKYQKNP